MPITELYSRLAISRGKSGINLFCTVSLCLLVWIGLYSMKSYGIYYMITYFIVINLLWLLVWQYFAWRIVRLPFADAARDILPFFVFASIIMAFTYFITQGITNIYLCLIAKIVIAATLYVGTLYLSGAKILRESINYILKR